MFDSEEGLITPATRQNAGRFARALPEGGLKDPAGTDSARLMVVAGRLSFVSASQPWGGGDATANRAHAHKASTLRHVRTYWIIIGRQHPMIYDCNPAKTISRR